MYNHDLIIISNIYCGKTRGRGRAARAGPGCLLMMLARPGPARDNSKWPGPARNIFSKVARPGPARKFLSQPGPARKIFSRPGPAPKKTSRPGPARTRKNFCGKRFRYNILSPPRLRILEFRRSTEHLNFFRKYKYLQKSEPVAGS